MILNVSGRTDVVAFYSKWFIKRYRLGFVDVRNPFNNNLVNRINFKDVDAILFCTKNPWPIIKYLPEIKHPILFHVTLTGYQKDIEPNVINKSKVIEGVKQVSKIIGIENIAIRYDPIFLSQKYNLDYHIKAFKRICALLTGYVNTIIVSFMDDYKNVRKNKKVLQYREFTENDYKQIGINFSKIAALYNMKVQTCFEERNLIEYGFEKGECLSQELAYKLTGKKFKKWRARKEGKCNCVEMVDIATYNTCFHFCKYCYANYDEKKVLENIANHDDDSSLLVGKLLIGDKIKIRE